VQFEISTDIDAALSDVWIVVTDVDLEPECSFSWTARTPGITTTAEHRLTPRPGGGVGVTLSIG